MVTDRWLETTDLPLLAVALARDEHHVGTEVEFFTDPSAVCKVYSDEDGPILFARAAKTLRLDLQYVDNADKKRNMRAMLEGFDKLAANAKEHGFSEIIFQSSSPLLVKFCKKMFGFVESHGELRKVL